MPGKRNLLNQRFGRGIVIAEEADRTRNQNVRWRLVCDCTTEYVASSDNLIQGHILSCGCLNQERLLNNTYRRIHGMSPRNGSHPAYKAWQNMKIYCTNPRSKSWHLYGGKGITFCPEWETFIGFWTWASEEWAPGTRFRRNNTDLGYFPENCYWYPRKDKKRRWATQ
jgi:hypothetical protein